VDLVATRELVEIHKYSIVHLALDYERLSFDNTRIFWLILIIGALPALRSGPVEAKRKTTMAFTFAVQAITTAIIHGSFLLHQFKLRRLYGDSQVVLDL
jgi:hypothetical protein